MKAGGLNKDQFVLGKYQLGWYAIFVGKEDGIQVQYGGGYYSMHDATERQGILLRKLNSITNTEAERLAKVQMLPLNSYVEGIGGNYEVLWEIVADDDRQG